jgi:hypothetical protein
MNYVQCLVDKGYLTQEEGDILGQVMATLPNNEVDLLKMLVGLELTGITIAP